MSDDEKHQQEQAVVAATERQPIFNLVPVIAAIAGIFVAIQAVDSFLLNESIRNDVLFWLAFIPYRLIENAAAPGGIWPLLWTPFTHAFLHAGWEHVLFNTVWFVIFGTPVAKRYGSVKLVILFLLSALVGAAAFAATTLPQFAILIGASGGVAGLTGASGGVAGLTGAAVRFMFQPVQVAVHPETGERIILGRRLATIAEVFRHPTARIFTIVWIGLNALVPLVATLLSANGLGTEGLQVQQIAWQAHIGGFLFGFLAVPLFERRDR